MLDVTDPASPEIVIGRRTKFLSQYYRYVRRGARRIAATSKDGSFDPVAFVNPDGGYVLVIKAAEEAELGIGGLPAGSYGLNYATSDAFNVSGPDQVIADGQILSVVIPGAGVTTIFQN